MLTTELTYRDIIAIEPRIGRLIEQAAAEERPTFDTLLTYKNMLCDLVGPGAENFSLATARAYEIVISKLMDCAGTSEAEICWACGKCSRSRYGKRMLGGYWLCRKCLKILKSRDVRIAGRELEEGMKLLRKDSENSP